MNIVPELDRLFGRLLGLIYPIGRDAEQCKAPDQHGDQTGWLTEPVEKITDHAYSCDKISSCRLPYLCKESGCQAILVSSLTGYETDR
jgi:hypothetical protein